MDLMKPIFLPFAELVLYISDEILVIGTHGDDDVSSSVRSAVTKERWYGDVVIQWVG